MGFPGPILPDNILNPYVTKTFYVIAFKKKNNKTYASFNATPFQDEYTLHNVKDPVFLDITGTVGNPQGGDFLSTSSPASYDMIYNANMIHISPYACTEGLFRNAGLLLKPGGLLVTYGPYAFDGVLTPESNVRFDAGLKSSNPDWGVRDVELQLKPLAQRHGLKLELIFDMPANNKTLVWVKQSAQ
jgi:SAM-dependent methyltransferase